MILESHHSLADVCRIQAQRRPESIAYTFLVDGETQEQTLTYGAFDTAVRARAARLQQFDARGERALLLYEPGLDFAVGFFSCLYAGVIPVPAYPPDPLRLERSMPRLRAMVNDAQASVVMGDPVNLRWADVLLEGLPSVNHVMDTSEIDDSEADQWRPIQTRADDLAFLQYTSGSTGQPKGVMITHRAIMYQVEQMNRWDVEGAVGVHWLPTYHDLGLVAGVLLPMYAHVPTISMSPFSFVQRPLRWLSAMSRYQATTTGGPNFAFDLCVRKISADECEGLDLSRWTHALNGGEPIRARTLRAFLDKFAPYGLRPDVFRPSYGMAETTLGITGNVKSEPRVRYVSAADLESQHRVVDADGDLNLIDKRELVACGPPLPRTEVRIVDPETHVDCGADQIGEIWVHSPSVAKGYWNRPEETERTFQARVREIQGGQATPSRACYLRTGDLGFMQNGELFITGRIKDLIIIAGRNHYPQDIEHTVVESHESLKIDSGAAFSIDVQGNEQLVIVQEIQRPKRYDPQQVIDDIRDAILQRHQISPHAIVLIKAGKIPKTTSGKIQRRECRQDYLEGRLPVIDQWSVQGDGLDAGRAVRFVEPRNELERNLADLWTEVLGVERVGSKDNFFDLGGQSIQATLLASRIRELYDVELPLGRVFADPTIANLAVVISDLKEGGSEARIPRSSGDTSLAASQRQLWTLDQLSPADSPSHTIYAVASVEGRLERGRLENALRKLMERHQVLQKCYLSIDGQPQSVTVEGGVPLRWANATNDLQQDIAEAIQHRFDLEVDVPIHIRVIRQSAELHTVIIVIHHIASDGWSLGIVASELSRLYAGEHLEPLPIQFSDFSAWQHEQITSGAFDTQLEFWADHLDSFELTEMKPDRPRAAIGGFESAKFDFQISEGTARKMHRLCANYGATSFMGLLATVQVLLARHTGSQDVCVGTPVAGRTRRELEGLVGMFVNTLALRAKYESDTSFEDHLLQVKRSVIQGLAHQDAPFQSVVDRVAPNRTATNPLFQWMFVLQNVPQAELLYQQLSGSGDSDGGANGGANGISRDLVATPLDAGSVGSGIDLTLEVRENAQPCSHHGQTQTAYDCSFQYNALLFDHRTIEQLAKHFVRLLDVFGDDPAQAVATAPLIDDQERQQLLVEWNDTHCDDIRNSPCVVELFEQRVMEHPDAVALVTDTQQVSYADLNRRANQLARLLQRTIRSDATQEPLVGVHMERGIEMVVALLAIQKAGAAYVPLDPNYPAERIAFMRQDSGLKVVLTSQNAGWMHEDEAADEAHPVVIDVSIHQESLQEEDDSNLSSVIEPNQLAYVIYTSGSTGTPKGVLIEQRGWRNTSLALANLLEVGAGDRVIQSSSPSFDGSMAEIGMTLCRGAMLVLPPPQADLCRVLREHRVNVCFLPPTAWSALQPDNYPDLKVAISVGEACPQDLARRWSEGRRFFNGYGPTEITVSATLSECDGSSPPPIGQPIANATVYVLDEQGQLAPKGAPGELYIGGAGVARGYLNREDLTQSRFVVNPFETAAKASKSRLYRSGDRVRWLHDGQLEFLGRMDDQVKVRGFRIELGELESTLSNHDSVEQAIAVMQRDASGHSRLTCYAVCSDSSITSAELREHLGSHLPPHCMPHHVVILDSIPVSPNGKLDVALLPPPPDRHDAAAPRTERESQLVDIWRKVLQAEYVGIHDNFFEIGGDSILAIQIVAQAQSVGVSITPRQMFQFQTIAELAVAADNAVPTISEQGELTGPATLLPIQRWFVAQSLKKPNIFNQSMLLKLSQSLEPGRLTVALTHILQHHDALRLRFRRGNPHWSATFTDLDLDSSDVVPTLLRHQDLRGMAPARAHEEIEASRATVEASLDIEVGRLLAAALYETDEGQQLLITAHHLAVDGVSWRILLEDLLSIYEQLQRGVQVRMPAKTTSVRQWAERLEDWAASAEFAEQSAFWRQMVSDPTRLPRDLKGLNTAASAETVRTALAADLTSSLLEANTAYRTQSTDLMLTALADAFGEWTGADALTIHVENHGREPMFDDVDLSRTVGWFTACFPVRLSLPESAKPHDRIRAVKEQLRSIPDHGLGYGLLRWLDEKNVAVQSAGVSPTGAEFNLPIELAFSFHGDLDRALPDDAPGRIVHGGATLANHPANLRPAVLEINAAIRDGQMQFEWTFSDELHYRETIEQLADRFQTALAELVDHCLRPGAGGATPSDFPLARLDQQDVDQLVGSRRDVSDVLPLTALQSGMVFRAMASGYDPNLHQATCELHGTLDRAAFQQAWQDVIQRHPALRCSFHWQGLSEPVQMVHRESFNPVEWLDWRDKVDVAEWDGRYEAFLSDDRKRGFSWETPPLMRVTMIQSADQRWRVVWTHHHVLSDGWSMPLIMKEVFLRYECAVKQQPVLLPSAPTFAEFLRWHGRQDWTDAKRFWKDNLRGFQTPTLIQSAARTNKRIQTDESNRHHDRVHATPSPSCEHECVLNSEAADQIRKFARQHHVTMSTVVQAAWGLVLAQQTDAVDVVFGATVSGRSAPVANIDAIVGMLINVLPTRMTFHADETVVGMLQRLQRQQADRAAFEHAPPGIVQRSCESPNGMLFDHLMVFENYPMDGAIPQHGSQRGSVAVHDIRMLEQTTLPLTIMVIPGESLSIRWVFDPDAIEAERVVGLAEAMNAMLGELTLTGERSLSDLLPRFASEPEGEEKSNQVEGSLSLASSLLEESSSSSQPPSVAEVTPPPAPPTTESERILHGIWSELLETEEIGIDDNLFDVGGYSMQALAIVARAREHGLRIDPAQMFLHPTIRQLALVATEAQTQGGLNPKDHSDGDPLAAMAKVLVPLREERQGTGRGARPPLLLVHPAGGNVFPYLELVAHMEPGQPTYGLQAYSLVHGGAADPTVEAMARRYVAEIQAVFPNGAVRLGGWSLGGLIAYEVARQLQQGGRDVEWVAIVDIAPTANDGVNDEADLRDLQELLPGNQALSLRELEAMSDAEQLALFTKHIENAGMVHSAAAPEIASRMLNVLRASARAARQYSPTSAEIPIQLIQAEQTKADLQSQWQSLTDSEVTLSRVPGDHMSIMRSGNVEHLAKRLSELCQMTREKLERS